MTEHQDRRAWLTCDYCGHTKDDVRIVSGDPMCEECLERDLETFAQAEQRDMELNAEALRIPPEDAEADQ